ncbi:MAG: hypothetical protein JNN25_09460 [Candidatus Kapabacteria bacterium]|nr:hypothetical protein [Candidatus Kapabacteria bacterium]
MKLLFSTLFFLFLVHCAEAQDWRVSRSTTGTIIGESLMVQMKSAPFPHPKRAQGHTYDGKSYPAAQHYRDSSVMIFLPKNFHAVKTLDVVVYLHGWNNCIDTANEQFRLAEQFSESRRNAVLVFPEGPRFAPDSFGGKLEDSCGLQRLLSETLETLRRTKNIKARLGNMILAGHSGAYRGMAYMLLRGGVSVREVWLFDALYGQTEKFAHWLETDCKRLRGRFVNIYTDAGGTKAETEKLMEDLTAWNVPFRVVEESDATIQIITKQDLKRSSAVFIHTDLSHNDVIAPRSQFRQLLETSCLRSR